MNGETRMQATEQVLALVKRTQESLANIGAGNVNTNGVFHHPATQLASLKVARDQINKAIAIIERKVDVMTEDRV